tara:strand:- start:625 stop:1278 length:654 start_codon:yes stop_codon:yes gene_type:complete
MKIFKVGDWVEITPRTDRSWDYWKTKHEIMKGTFAEVERVEISKDKQHIFYYVRDLDGVATWFLDRHLILSQKQDRRFIKHMRESCKKLQEHEKLCKKLRDEILEDVFAEKQDEEFEEFWDDDGVDLTDDLEEDWETVVTKPIVPLPGKSKRKARIRKTTKKKSKVKKTKTKQKQTSTKQSTQSGGKVNTSNMDPADWMTDDELEEYLDNVYGIDWL